MNKSIILGLVVCAISLNSLGALAVTDDKYPASNFQPKVTYIDENAEQTQLTKASVVDEKYPAANFESKVIYADESAAEQVPDQFDPKYPAAYFKPKVIYP